VTPRSRRGPSIGASLVRALLAAALGVAAALLVSCSGSSSALIPAANAGPLRADFEAVASAAEKGNGKCSETESALSKTEIDLGALPASVSAELRSTLRQGVDNLKVRALGLCAQPLPQPTNTTTTTTSTTTTPPPTKSSTTPSTPTTTPTTPTTPTTTNPGGGTPPEEPSKGGGSEPGARGEEPPGKGNGGQEAGK
jgi:hypothetical protein